MMKKIFDVTLPITNKIIQYPNDPKVVIEEVCSVAKNGFALNKFTLNGHVGTHVDFPSHIVEGGKTSSDYPLDCLIGNGVILEVPSEKTSIDKKFINSHAGDISSDSIVLFKTSNSDLYSVGEFSERYVYIEHDAAQELAKMKPRIVGIDYLSFDRVGNKGLPVHNALLANNILLVEGLYLKNVPPGKYKIYIIPINMPHMDGLPARVFIQLLHQSL